MKPPVVPVALAQNGSMRPELVVASRKPTWRAGRRTMACRTRPYRNSRAYISVPRFRTSLRRPSSGSSSSLVVWHPGASVPSIHGSMQPMTVYSLLLKAGRSPVPACQSRGPWQWSAPWYGPSESCSASGQSVETTRAPIVMGLNFRELPRVTEVVVPATNSVRIALRQVLESASPSCTASRCLGLTSDAAWWTSTGSIDVAAPSCSTSRSIASMRDRRGRFSFSTSPDGRCPV